MKNEQVISMVLAHLALITSVPAIIAAIVVLFKPKLEWVKIALGLMIMAIVLASASSATKPGGWTDWNSKQQSDGK